MEKLSVMITGAASGIGLATVKRFAEEGHSVYALDILPMEQSENIIPIRADVTDSESVTEVAEKLSSLEVKLDVIVLAAGVHAMASLVESDFSISERIIDVNLTGTMRISCALHRFLKPKGRVIIVTSEVAVLDPMPFNGLYNVSKTALECYAQALRQELGLLSQRVITVRPGATETPLAKSSADATEKLARDTVLYRNEAKHFSSLVRKFTGTPISPDRVGALIYRAAVVKRPRYSYSINKNIGLVLLGILPKRLQCAVIRALLKRK